MQVEYGSETATLRLATRQGTLDAALAAHLYAGAEPTTVRGQPGFAAEDGQLLVWQETSGLVASITSSGVGRTTVDDFVDGLHTVTEDAWVVLRTAGDAGERTLDTPAQPESAGTEGGVEYRIEAFERGSLDTGLESCRRLVVVGATRRDRGDAVRAGGGAIRGPGRWRQARVDRDCGRSLRRVRRGRLSLPTELDARVDAQRRE